MKHVLLLVFVVFTVSFAHAADTTGLYNPYSNAENDLKLAVAQAKKQNKHVFIQVGGNWCTWCYKFHSFLFRDSALKAVLENNYVVYHLNYSKENENRTLMKKLGFPQRFGFPVLIILDGNGERLHTQDSALLEKGNGYDAEKVKSFLLNWTPLALNESYYK